MAHFYTASISAVIMAYFSSIEQMHLRGGKLPERLANTISKAPENAPAVEDSECGR